jgi:hypothetical protein
MKNTKQTDATGDAVDDRFPNTPVGIVRSRDAFLRDLPALLANPKYDRWCAAYCGDERIGVAESQGELIRECKRRGLHPNEFYIGCIFPHGEDDEEVDFGGNEFDDIEDADEGASPNGTEPIP